MEKLKCKVVMLPTDEKATSIFAKRTNYTLGQSSRSKSEGTLSMCIGISIELKFWEPQHLYFVSERKIKENDWVHINLRENSRITRVINLQGEHPVFSVDITEGCAQLDSLTKVEATTDPSLGLPLIPQSFVEKYVEKQGKIEDVMIDIEVHHEEDTSQGYVVGRGQPAIRIEEIQTRKDNTVIVSKVEESVFTIKDLKDAFIAGNYSTNFTEWYNENF